jgi:hypothetical protein
LTKNALDAVIEPALSNVMFPPVSLLELILQPPMVPPVAVMEPEMFAALAVT